MAEPHHLLSGKPIPPPYYSRLAAAANQFLANDQLAECVIWSVMASEVLTEQVFYEAYWARQLAPLGDAISELFQSYNLANERVRRIYETLTDDKPTATPWWPDFKDLVQLRNGVVHGDSRSLDRTRVVRGHNGAMSLINHLLSRTYGMPIST